MSSTVITLLSLSVSGSILALILLACKPLLKNRVSKAFSFYIWILVMLRLVLPVSAPVNAMEMLFNIEPQGLNSAPTWQTDIPAEIEAGRTDAPTGIRTVLPEQENNETVHSQKPADTQRPLNFWSFIRNDLLWVWLAGTALSLSWFITAYLCFSRRIRRSCVPPHSGDLAVFEQMRGGRRVTMACSSLVSTPVLIGVYHPVVVLPQLAYVLGGMGEELKCILRHELTHYRRKDVLFKWSVAAVTSLHWFNPLMFVIRGEISRACELSCDEAVIGGMSESEKQFYGNTLLTFSAGQKLPAGILATTLCEEKEQLKERLITIKRYKKKSTWAVVLMLALALLFTGCAAALGAATGSGSGDWVNAELSLGENGEPRVRYHEQDEWVTLGEPIAAPKEWSSSTEIDSRQEAQALIGSPETSMAMVSADDGWLAVTYGNGVANADTYIYRTHDGGRTWNETTQIMEAKWYPNEVLFLDDQHAMVAIGLFTDAPILRTCDGGVTWTQIELPLDDGIWEARSLSAEQNVITLTVADRSSDNDGMMETLTSEDGGTTWQRIDQDVLSLAENFGKALKAVTLTAPQDVAAESIKEHYSEYVTPELLAKWLSDPQSAPGRTVSSPWPDRIEITGIMPTNDGEYTVSGEIIEVTSTELQNGKAAAKYPVALIIAKQDDRWLISDVTIINEDDTEHPSAALEQLADSIRYVGGELSFQIPENYPNQNDWNILIYGRTEQDGFGMSVHYLTEENENKSWEAGRRYVIPLTGNADNYTELWLTASLPDESGKTDENSIDTDLLKFITSPTPGVATDSKPAIFEAVNDRLDTDVEFTNGWRSALVEQDVNGRGYIIVQAGSLKSDPEQGVAVVCHQTKGSEQYVIDGRFLTPDKHGAIKIESLGAKDFEMSVVAEDGYTWMFDAYNGFQAGTEPDSQAVSKEAISNLDWMWPLEGHETVTAPYGSRIHPITHETVFHDHIDIGAPKGSPVYTALAGTVSETGYDDEWGNYIVIDHDNGIETFYRHLSELKVSAGDPVDAGDTIGTVGSTGEATGPHLAFGVRIDESSVDPMDYFE